MSWNVSRVRSCFLDKEEPKSLVVTLFPENIDDHTEMKGLMNMHTHTRSASTLTLHYTPPIEMFMT